MCQLFLVGQMKCSIFFSLFFRKKHHHHNHHRLFFCPDSMHSNSAWIYALYLYACISFFFSLVLCILLYCMLSWLFRSVHTCPKYSVHFDPIWYLSFYPFLFYRFCSFVIASFFSLFLILSCFYFSVGWLVGCYVQ